MQQVACACSESRTQFKFLLAQWLGWVDLASAIKQTWKPRVKEAGRRGAFSQRCRESRLSLPTQDEPQVWPSMTSTILVPAAQYLRMSTEDQQYSIANQEYAIQQYAEEHGYTIVSTYVDAGRSGVSIKTRTGLRRLLQDVMNGRARYRTILVYDVSRWGRFQDTDEAAHYEFLCKNAGIPVRYCAEQFENDETMPSLIMKSLKRAMAGEYSRELGVKVFAGQKKLARCGFKQGGIPGYGLRRLLVSADGSPKQLLREGERKSIASDRVIQIAGPDEEVCCVREIYQMLIRKRMSFCAIARELNRRRIKYREGAEWNNRAVGAILRNPKYMGSNVFGRTSCKLYSAPVQVPRSEWTIVPGAFEALVEPAAYAEAQRIIEGHTRNKSDAELLEALRAILAEEGRITSYIIRYTPNTPSAETYAERFGALSRAYELIGYYGYRDGGWHGTRRQIQVLRDNLMREIVTLSEARVSIEARGPARRTRLRLQGGRLVSVLASRCFRGYKGAIRWLVGSIPDECRLVTLVARLNVRNDAFKDFFVLRSIGISARFVVSEQDPRLHRGVRLSRLAEFFGAVRKVTAQGKRR